MKEKRQKKIKPSRMAFPFRVREGEGRRKELLLFRQNYLICWIKQSSMLGVMGAISIWRQPAAVRATLIR